MKVVKIIGFFIIIILTLISLVMSQEIEKDVQISVIVPEIINESTIYNKLFLVENLDDVSGEDDGLQLTVSLILKMNSSIFFQENYSKSINSYSSSNMGVLNLSAGDYELCGELIPINFLDNNSANNIACMNLTVIKPITSINITINETNTTVNSTTNTTVNHSMNETSNETEFDVCSCNLSIFTEKQLYENGEKINFDIDSCNEIKQNGKFANEINYWIEDLNEKIVKQIISTTTISSKSYTPNLAREEYGLAINAQIGDCKKAEKMVFVKGTTKENIEPYLKLEAPEKAEAGEFILVLIEGYKGDTKKTLISLWIEQKNKVSETTKIYVEQEQAHFKFRVPVLVKENAEKGKAIIVAEGIELNAETETDITKIQETIPKAIILPEITSISTRKQIMDEEIENILLTIKISSENAGFLVVNWSNETQTVFLPQLTNQINLSLKEPTENFQIALYSSDLALIDIKTYNLTLEDRRKKEVVQIIEVQNKTNPKKNNSITTYTTYETKKKNSTILPIIFTVLAGLIALFFKDIKKHLTKTKIYKGQNRPLDEWITQK